MLKISLILALFLASFDAYAQGIYLPNLKQNASGTYLTTGDKRMLDVNIASGTIAFTEQAVATNGAASLPATVKVVAGWDGTNVRTLSVDSSGRITNPLAAATAALQTTGNSSLASLDTKASTTNTSLSSIDGKTPALGQGLMAASVPVAIASNQSAIPASQSGTWNITNVSGTVSLPTGAATETTLSAVSGKLPATLGQKAMASALAVSIASDQTAMPVSQSGSWTIASIPGTISLPTGAATAALQSTGNTSVASIDGKLGSLGQKTMAGSAPVVIASDQGSLAVTPAQLNVVAFLDTTPVLDTSTTTINGSGGALVTVVASLSTLTKAIRVADTTGQFIGVYNGTTLIAIIEPGMNDILPVSIAAASVIKLRSMSTSSISSGKIMIEFLG